MEIQFLNQKKKCVGCDKFIDKDIELPQIESTNEKVISEETAYQMTSILQAVQRGKQKN